MGYVQQRLMDLGVPKDSRRKYPPGTTAKPCTVCKVIKVLDEFSPIPNGALGRSARCKACINAIGREYTRKNREFRAGRSRPEHCEACNQLKTLRHPLHWDHDHVNGRFRGWLCHHCNTALGASKDSIDRLEALIQYLRRGGGPA